MTETEKEFEAARVWFGKVAIPAIQKKLKSAGFEVERINGADESTLPSLLIKAKKTENAVHACNLSVIASWMLSDVWRLHGETVEYFEKYVEGVPAHLSKWNAQDSIDWATRSQKNPTPIGDCLM